MNFSMLLKKLRQRLACLAATHHNAETKIGDLKPSSKTDKKESLRSETISGSQSHQFTKSTMSKTFLMPMS